MEKYLIQEIKVILPNQTIKERTGLKLKEIITQNKSQIFSNNKIMKTELTIKKPN